MISISEILISQHEIQSYNDLKKLEPKIKSEDKNWRRGIILFSVETFS